MFWLLAVYLGIGVALAVREAREKHWKDVWVQGFLAVLSLLLTVSYEWEMPQLLLPYFVFRNVFEQMSSVFYQLF